MERTDQLARLGKGVVQLAGPLERIGKVDWAKGGQGAARQIPPAYTRKQPSNPPSVRQFVRWCARIAA